MIKTINVTLRDIKKGCVLKSASCPVARAILRHWSGGIAVCQQWITFIPGSGKEHIDRTPPLSVIKFITTFDIDDPVKPFKFKLDIPE